MSRSSRRKGIAGEAEVARILRAAGLSPRGLEAAGDWLCVRENGRALAFEVKRAERLKIPEWLRQGLRDAPPGSVPVLAFRQNAPRTKAEREAALPTAGRWYVALALEELLELLGHPSVSE